MKVAVASADEERWKSLIDEMNALGARKTVAAFTESMMAVLEKEKLKAAFGGDSSGRRGQPSAAYNTGGAGQNKGNKNKGNKSKTCYYCDKPGHIEEDCWEKYPDRKPRNGKGGGGKGKGRGRDKKGDKK